MTARISAVIPAYNAQLFLAEALESVFSQEQAVHEVIVVDDGSTDATAAVIASYGGRVRAFAQRNAGISASRNAGLAQITGDIVAFLDADDIWPSDSLAVRAAVLDARPDVDLVFGAVEAFLSPALLEGGGQPTFQLPSTRPAPMAGATLIRADAFRRIGAFRDHLSVGETLDWMARARDAGLKEWSLDAVVLRRRIHGNNTVATRADKHSDYLRALKSSLDRRRGASSA